MPARVLIWEGVDGWRADAATVTWRAPDAPWAAEGVQIGVDPDRYRIAYRLELGDELVTRRLEIHAHGDDWARTLDLRHDGSGHWTFDATGPGGESSGTLDELSDARDCDLGRCALTNAMPVQRHGLHNEPGAQDFVMAFVSVPDLTVTAAAQRYEHVAPGRVRYTGAHRDYSGELSFDEHGFVTDYPQLARRAG